MLPRTRRNKKAAERRAQYARADGRAMQAVMRSLQAVGSHRGNELSKLGNALLSAVSCAGGGVGEDGWACPSCSYWHWHATRVCPWCAAQEENASARPRQPADSQDRPSEQADHRSSHAQDLEDLMPTDGSAGRGYPHLRQPAGSQGHPREGERFGTDTIETPPGDIAFWRELETSFAPPPQRDWCAHEAISHGALAGPSKRDHSRLLAPGELVPPQRNDSASETDRSLSTCSHDRAEHIVVPPSLQGRAWLCTECGARNGDHEYVRVYSCKVCKAKRARIPPGVEITPLGTAVTASSGDVIEHGSVRLRSNTNSHEGANGKRHTVAPGVRSKFRQQAPIGVRKHARSVTPRMREGPNQFQSTRGQSGRRP